MLRLPPFIHHRPETLEAALYLAEDLHAQDTTFKWAAGGTDILVNMKHHIDTPEHLISLSALALNYIHTSSTHIHIGAGTKLFDVAHHPLLTEKLSGLVSACRQIASPALQRMGTLGGNICLDTRCLYINQTAFWRESLGYCLKKDGSVCHVVQGGRRCVAAAVNDAALPLWLYGAELIIRYAHNKDIHEECVPLSKFFVADGAYNKTLTPERLLVEIRIPHPSSGMHVSFEKLRMRKSIDFPLVNLALALLKHESTNDIAALHCVVGALGARPKLITLSKHAPSTTADFDDAHIANLSDRIFKACTPLDNIATDKDWRRQMLRVLFKRALRTTLDD